MSDDDMRKEIDELMRLFKRLLEERSMGDIPGIDREHMNHLKFLFSHYDSMKGQIHFELSGQMGEPFRKMISHLIIQLKNELGEDTATPSETVSTEPLQDLYKESNPIDWIDRRLKEKNLSEEEINHLLDERNKLLNQNIKTPGKEE